MYPACHRLLFLIFLSDFVPKLRQEPQFLVFILQELRLSPPLPVCPEAALSHFSLITSAFWLPCLLWGKKELGHGMGLKNTTGKALTAHCNNQRTRVSIQSECFANGCSAVNAIVGDNAVSKEFWLLAG